VRTVTWRQRFGLDFDFKPALMGAFGVVVCGLLLVSVINSSGVQRPSTGGMFVANDPSAMFVSQPGDPAFHDGGFIGSEETPASTVPVSGAAPSDSPFGQFTPRTQPAKFILGGE
jgi:hypothetical protein